LIFIYKQTNIVPQVLDSGTVWDYADLVRSKQRSGKLRKCNNYMLPHWRQSILDIVE